MDDKEEKFIHDPDVNNMYDKSLVSIDSSKVLTAGSITFQKPKIQIDANEVTFTADGSNITLQDMDARLSAIEERLCILERNESEIPENLREAYKEYKFTEQLILGENNGNK